jgi:hypothetical protein
VLHVELVGTTGAGALWGRQPDFFLGDRRQSGEGGGRRGAGRSKAGRAGASIIYLPLP